MDVAQQLADLRRRIANVENRRYQHRSLTVAAPGESSVVSEEDWGGVSEPTPRAATARERSDAQFVHELLSGEVVRTPKGEHFETEKLWERHRRHGSVDISDLA